MPSLRINPLLAKELRIRMRTWRTFAMVSLYLLGLGGFALLFFSAMFSTVRMGYDSLSELGRAMFAFLAFLQSSLVIFFGARPVGQRRQRRTGAPDFDLWPATQLTPGDCSGQNWRPQCSGAADGCQLAFVCFVFLMGESPRRNWQLSPWPQLCTAFLWAVGR